MFSEKDMEDAVAEDPEKYIGEPGLKLISRQYRIGNYIFDLLFEDRHGGKLIVELQKGTLDRQHTYKIIDYYYEFKEKYSSEFVDLMVIANRISRERKKRLKDWSIEFKEIPEDIFKKDNEVRIEHNTRDNDNYYFENYGDNHTLNTSQKEGIKAGIPDFFISEVDKHFSKNQTVSTSQLKKMAKSYGINPGSIIPSDYCYNLINQAHFDKRSTQFEVREGNKYLIFEQLDRGQYRYLGPNANYTGDIIWRGEKVGRWKNGKLVKPPRKPLS
jgi:hypothetical protein